VVQGKGIWDVADGCEIVGIRKTDAVVEFFERIVNAVHKELPGARFAFNGSIEKTREAVERVVAGGE
jgi:hypothetical protein